MWVSQLHQRDHKLSISSPANLNNSTLQRMVKSGIFYLCHPDDGVGVPLLELLVDGVLGVGASEAARDECALLVGDLQKVVELLGPVSWLPQIVLHVQPLRNTTWKWRVVLRQKTEISNL